MTTLHNLPSPRRPLPYRLLARVGRKNYAIQRRLFEWELIRQENHYSAKPILVLSMGKVGSKTVTESLRATNIDRHVYHFHHLRSAVLDRLDEMARMDIVKHKKQAHYVWTCRRIAGLVDSDRGTEKWKFVTVVRDPVARNMSDFFQNLTVRQPGPNMFHVTSDWHNIDVTFRTENIQTLVKEFYEKFEHEIHIQYFDSQFRKTLGIDLLDRPFDKNRGYGIFNGSDAEVLVLRLEDLKSSAAPAFREYLGLDSLSLIHTNSTADKDAAGELYKLFKANIRFQKFYLDRIYNSKFVKQFYTAEQIHNFRNRWTSA